MTPGINTGTIYTEGVSCYSCTPPNITGYTCIPSVTFTPTTVTSSLTQLQKVVSTVFSLGTLLHFSDYSDSLLLDIAAPSWAEMIAQ